MKSIRFIFIELLLIQFSSFLRVGFSQKYDFFYFVQQFKNSGQDHIVTQRSCCYPTTGKPPSDFGIHGLWPNYNNNSYPSNCNKHSPFDGTKISDLIPDMQKAWPSIACPSSNNTKFWTHEWEKHGTCSESVLDQHSYFEAALKIKEKVNLLQVLENAGIKPNGKF